METLVLLGRLTQEPSLVSTAEDAPLGRVTTVESGMILSVPVTWIPLAERTGICPGRVNVKSAARVVVPPFGSAITVPAATVIFAPSGRVRGVPGGKETEAPPLGRVAVTVAAKVARVLPD